MKTLPFLICLITLCQLNAQKNYLVFNRMTLEEVAGATVTSDSETASFMLSANRIGTKKLKRGDRITINAAGFKELTFTVADLNRQAENIYLDLDDSLFAEYKKSYPFYNTLQDTAGVAKKPDQMAQFPGGTPALKRFLMEHIRYPQEAAENDLSGTVFLQLLVETDGRISRISVARGLTLVMDTEAVRVVSIMPKWEPALYAGKPVRSIFNLPIVFLLQ